MAWMTALHLTFLLIWCAGLFYLPGLFAAYSRAGTVREHHQMRIITRFIFFAVATPAAALAILTGIALAYATDIQGNWLPAKALVVLLMILFHMYCGRRVIRLGKGRRMTSNAMLLALIAIPAVLVPLVLWLVLAKPDLTVPGL